MADKILSAISELRPLWHGEGWQDGIDGIISRYADAAIYRNPAAGIAKLHKELIRAVAKEYFPLARRRGMISAKPILEKLGGESLAKRGSKIRGKVLGYLNRYSKADLQSFQAALETETGALSGRIKSAFADAYRDGRARAGLISDLVAADKKELAGVRAARAKTRDAATKLADAESSGNAAAIATAEKAMVAVKVGAKATVSFLARLELAVEARTRDTMRREAQRAQTAAFQEAGFNGEYVWVSVNGPGACPDCIDLHGTARKLSDWNGQMPGDGQTVCGAACMCQLVPADYRTKGNIDKPVELRTG